MGLFKGGALRLVQTALYLITFCCSGIILGFYSYFLARQATRDTAIPTWQKAVEGISGVAVLYSICAVLLTCCLAGVKLFSFLGLFLDVLFFAGMIAIAVLTRDGAGSCRGDVNTPLGHGNTYTNPGALVIDGTSSDTSAAYSVNLRTACRFNTVCFAVSIIAAVFFLLTAVMQVLLVRHHKKEKRYGPGPDNEYTSGSAKPNFWARKPKSEKHAGLDDTTGTTVGAGGLTVPATRDHRASHETGYTGSTVASPNAAIHDKTEIADVPGNPRVTHLPHGVHGGYYVEPVGPGVKNLGNLTNNTTTTHGTATNY